MLIETVLSTDGAIVAGGTERAGQRDVGSDLGTLVGRPAVGEVVSTDPAALFDAADVVIDFTTPDAIATHAELAVRHRTALVVGTTGLTREHADILADAACTTPIVQAANMSVGINLLLGLTRRVAALLGDDYDIEIVEMHHRHKVDAPSGTALALGRAAADGCGADIDAVSRRSRDGLIGARPRGEIGFATLRGGDVVGDHTVVFAGDGERLELTHRASARTVFARGAVRAALWTKGRQPHLYGMQEVLGLEI